MDKGMSFAGKVRDFFKSTVTDWKMVSKPEHVLKDTLFVAAASVVGAGMTAVIDFGVGKAVTMIAGIF